jgi:hypothetical protein
VFVLYVTYKIDPLSVSVVNRLEFTNTRLFFSSLLLPLSLDCPSANGNPYTGLCADAVRPYCLHRFDLVKGRQGFLVRACVCMYVFLRVLSSPLSFSVLRSRGSGILFILFMQGEKLNGVEYKQNTRLDEWGPK